MAYKQYGRIAVENIVMTFDDLALARTTQFVRVQASCENLRITFDGSDPTSSRGTRLLVGKARDFAIDDIVNMRAVSEDPAAVSVLHFQAWSFEGDSYPASNLDTDLCSPEEESSASSASSSSFSSLSSLSSRSSSSRSSQSSISISTSSSSQSVSSSSVSSASSASSLSSLSSSSMSSSSVSSLSSMSSRSSQSSVSSLSSSSPSSLSSLSSLSSRSTSTSSSSQSTSTSSSSESSQSSSSSSSTSSTSSLSSSSLSTSSSSWSSQSSTSTSTSSVVESESAAAYPYVVYEWLADADTVAHWLLGRHAVLGFNRHYGVGASFVLNEAQGATISTAKFIWTAHSSSSGGVTINVTLTVREADSGDIVVYPDVDPDDIYGWTGYDHAGVWSTSGSPEEIDLAIAIQAIVNRAGWVSGNIINIKFEANTSNALLGTFLDTGTIALQVNGNTTSYVCHV